MQVDLVKLLGRAADLVAMDPVGLALKLLETVAGVAAVRDGDRLGRVRAPSVATVLLHAPEMADLVDGTLLPALELGHGLHTGGVLDGLIALIVGWQLGGAFNTTTKSGERGNLVGLAVDQEVGDHLWEVGLEREEVVVIGRHVQRILLVAAIVVDPGHDLLHRVVNVEHGAEHVIHVVGMGGPIDVALLVHQEEALVRLAQELDGVLDNVLHLGDRRELIRGVCVAHLVQMVEGNHVAGCVPHSLEVLLDGIRISRVDTAVRHVARLVRKAAHDLVPIVGVHGCHRGQGLVSRLANLVPQHRPLAVVAISDAGLVVNVVLHAEPAARVVATIAVSDGQGRVDRFHHGALQLRAVVAVVAVRDEGGRRGVEHRNRRDDAAVHAAVHCLLDDGGDGRLVNIARNPAGEGFDAGGHRAGGGGRVGCVALLEADVEAQRALAFRLVVVLVPRVLAALDVVP
mmetsp:Transcript_9422/g.31292  ORF Transcript_9422/g.31292 Transcript_9422/m.31292 type:complete len:458 (+) Transcript_9422:256-1629(+)